MLEKHHISVSFMLMRAPHADFLRQMDKESVVTLKRLMRSNILATDMAQHSGLVTAISEKVGVGTAYFGSEEGQIWFSSILLHAADLFKLTFGLSSIDKSMISIQAGRWLQMAPDDVCWLIHVSRWFPM